MSAPLTPSSPDEQKTAGFAYLGLALCLIPTVIIYLSNKDKSKFVEFHCLQAIGFVLVGLCLNMVGILLNIIPFLGMLMSFGITAVVFIAWLVVSIQTLQGKNYDFPLIGEFIRTNMIK